MSMASEDMLRELARMMLVCDRSTKGPWYVSDAHGVCVVAKKVEKGHYMEMVADLSPASSAGEWTGKREDAEFMVLARKQMPLLLNMVMLLLEPDGVNAEEIEESAYVRRGRIETLALDVVNGFTWGEEE